MAESVLNNELWNKVDQIEGWLSKPEADQLYGLCTGVWCEIGSWKGRSTFVLAQKHKGYAIDWFKGSSEHEGGTNTLKEFLQNTEPVKENITVIQSDYTNAVSKVPEVQLLFLDAEHDYKHTKEAFDLYMPKVVSGGVIVLHDVWGYSGEREPEKTPWPGVTKFAYELLEDKRFEHISDAHRSMAIRKL